MVDKSKFLIDLVGSPNTDLGKLALDKQSEPQQVFTCVWELEGDVNNGGFQQYYSNCSGDGAHKAVWALLKLNAPSMARLVRAANSVFDDGIPPSDQQQRRAQLGKMPAWVPSFWDTLDREFFKYPDNLTELLYGFVQQHRAAFRLPA